MNSEWLINDHHFSETALVVDAGGTNVNFGLVGYNNPSPVILARGWMGSGGICDFLDSLELFLNQLERDPRYIAPSVCSIAAAGPVKNNSCHLTNCDWHIDGDEIENFLKIKTIVINDFIAISHGIPVLDHDDLNSIIPLTHCDGSTSTPVEQGVKLVIGPGTGLGVSYIVPHEGTCLPFPSEGGHSDFAAFDDETARLKNYVTNNTLVKPGIEPFLSGPGIVNIFNFLKSTKNFSHDDGFQTISSAPEEKKAELISAYSRSSIICRETMKLFAKILGHVAGSFSAIFLPAGGVYIAGGIAAKNVDSFLLPGYFMTCFEKSYNAAMREFLKTVPVYVVMDYSVSLYGAAMAAENFLSENKSKIVTGQRIQT